MASTPRNRTPKLERLVADVPSDPEPEVKPERKRRRQPKPKPSRLPLRRWSSVRCGAVTWRSCCWRSRKRPGVFRNPSLAAAQTSQHLKTSTNQDAHHHQRVADMRGGFEDLQLIAQHGRTLETLIQSWLQ